MTELKYTTVEGHPIEVGKEYVARGGEVVTILAFNPHNGEWLVIGVVAGEKYPRFWYANGCYLVDQDSMHDLMRPYVKKRKIQVPERWEVVYEADKNPCTVTDGCYFDLSVAQKVAKARFGAIVYHPACEVEVCDDNLA